MTITGLFTSRANYWLGLALDLTGSLALIAAGCAITASVVAIPIAVAAGAVTFTIYEYALHRWLYHGRDNLVAALHRRHHRDPAALVGAPFYFSLGITALDWLLAAWLVDRASASVFAGTILLCYAHHSLIHHAAHGWPHSRRLGARSRLHRHHLLHHRTGDGNFGISTALWDRVFATALPRPRRGDRR